MSCCKIIRSITGLGLLLLSTAGTAQEPERYKVKPSFTRANLNQKRLANPPIEKGNLWVRAHPLGILDYFDWNITGGVEYGIARQFTVLADIGFIGATLYGRSLEEERTGLQPASGYLARVGTRWYVPNAFSTWYFEAVAAHKRVAYTLGPTWVQYGVVNGVPAFERWQTLQGKKEVTLLQLITGTRNRLGRQGSWYYEIWGGLGWRNRNYYADLPPGSSVDRPRGLRFFTGFDFGKTTTLDVPAGFRLVYQIK